jgi:hypothetical protein
MEALGGYKRRFSRSEVLTEDRIIACLEWGIRDLERDYHSYGMEIEMKVQW